MKPELVMLIPSIAHDELAYVQALTREMPDDKLHLFISVYNQKRRRTDTILICCLLGFIAAAGIHRFVLGHIGMGLLYLFTGGLCLIGTIVDIINHKQLTFDYNQKMAVEAMQMTR